MDNHNRYDVKISGIGKTNGGVFANVVIDGHGSINGDIDCINFNLNGVGRVEGNIKAQKVEINGQANIGGSADVKELKVEGMTGIKGNLKAETVESSGMIKVNGDCEAEKFISKGGFAITGLLNAGNINIDIDGPCKAKEIGGEIIEIKVRNMNSFKKIINSVFSAFDNIKFGLAAESIEGDEIYIEHTKVKVVRGKNITIGPECEIDLIEYEANLNASKNSIIKQSKMLK